MDINSTGEFKELTNEELISEIGKTNDIQLSKIGTMAYVEVFNRTLYLKTLIEEDRGLVEDIIEEDTEFKRLYDLFEKNIVDLKQVTRIDKEDGYSLEELKLIRRDIVKFLRCISSYTTEISYTNEIAKDLAYKEFLKENAGEIEERIDFEKLTRSVQMFLSEDGKTIKSKVKDITSVLPVRISKNKYNDMVSNAINKALKEASEDIVDTIISRYKAIFNGATESEYGLHLDRYFRKAQEARQFELKTATESELNSIYNDTFETITELNKISNIVREYGIIVNRLIAIKMLKENIKENLESKSIKDLIVYWNNYLDNPKANKSKVLEQYKKVFKELDKKFQETNARLQSLSMENFGRKNKIEDDLKMSLQKSQDVLNYINDYALEKEEISEMSYYEAAGAQYVRKSVESFIEYMDRNVKDLSNIQRKARMRRMLTVVDGVFASPNEFFEYFANSINLSTKKEETVAITNSILEIINYYRSSSKSNLN